MTPANYKDAIEERSITKLCGYPICANKLGKVRFFISVFTDLCKQIKHIIVFHILGVESVFPRLSVAFHFLDPESKV